jgi:hypothetical protein
MNTYYKIGILVAAVVIIGGLLWFAFLRPEPAPQETRQPQNLDQVLTDLSGNNPNQFIVNQEATDQPPLVVEPTGVDLAELSPEEQASQKAQVAAKNFVERWGTYSNQTNLGHLRELSGNMTQKMQAYVEDYINQIRASHPYQDGYYGITTRAAAANIDNFNVNASQLEVLVAARREETQPNGEVRAFNQDVRVKLIKSGEDWLVDSVYWIAE